MNNNFTTEKLTYPTFISFNNISALVNHSSANFYGTLQVPTFYLDIPIGIDIIPNTIYKSYDSFLQPNSFNKKKESQAVVFKNNADLTILNQVTCTHDILIQCKINKFDGTNYANQRAVIVTLVNQYGTVYDDAMVSNQQPDSGDHQNIILKGNIIHNTNDIVRLKFNIVQDNKINDQTDSKITIFQISWDILVLKNF